MVFKVMTYEHCDEVVLPNSPYIDGLSSTLFLSHLLLLVKYLYNIQIN